MFLRIGIGAIRPRLQPHDDEPEVRAVARATDAAPVFAQENMAQKAARQSDPCQEMIARASTEMKAEKYNEVLPLLNSIIQKCPMDHRGYAFRAEVLGHAGRCAEAMADADRANMLDPAHIACLKAKLDCLVCLGRYQEALARANSYAKKIPYASYIYSNRGYSLCGLGNYKAAVPDLTIFLEVHPTNFQGLTARSLAREFPRGMISKSPFANSTAPPTDAFKRLQADGFSNWRLQVDGMVAHPASFSLADLKSLPASRQITEVACEEGWSYVAEWIGAPLIDVLRIAGISPQARYIFYFTTQADWWESIDMADALHPQTLLTYGMNDGDLPVAFGGPLRMRVPRQLGYKSLKYLTRLVAADSPKAFGKGLGSPGPEYGYSWYAGI